MMRSLRYQLGFLYLTTGANGAGKTLFTLLDVRKLQLDTGRPVYYYGFTPKKPIEDFGWLPFEPERWQDLPDGSICIVDECQKVMPLRGTGRPPDWIQAIAEVHRKRGFDFFLITQHPMNFDAFIRRLIAAPGWHRHFKASMMGDSSNELRWTAVVDQPQKNGTGDSGDVTSRGFPKEVYHWYESASEHTARKRVPWKVWGAIAGVILAIAMVSYAVYRLVSSNDKMASVPSAKAAVSGLAPALPKASLGQSSQSRSVTVEEYLEQRQARLSGFPHTAPVYDSVTAPVEAPYPAACVHMGKTCKCYTQQATLLQVSAAACLQIVQQGFFMDWKAASNGDFSQRGRVEPPHVQTEPSQAQQMVQAQPVRTVPTPMPASRPEPPHNEYLQGLASRNAQVRSSLQR